MLEFHVDGERLIVCERIPKGGKFGKHHDPEADTVLRLEYSLVGAHSRVSKA